MSTQPESSGKKRRPRAGRAVESKRRALVLSEQQVQIARLYAQRHTQAEIAEQLGINQATVSRQLKAVQQAWKDAAVAAWDEHLARELAKIDELERVYWDAWRRSIRKEVRLTIETERQEVTKRSEGGEEATVFEPVETKRKKTRIEHL